MDFYEVLEKRRTIRDFSNRKVSDEVLDKILSAAFKAPTNDHLLWCADMKTFHASSHLWRKIPKIFSRPRSKLQQV